MMPSLEEARLWYPAHDPVHGFDHVLRVLRLAEQFALTEGADLEIVRAAALLHDAEAPFNQGKPKDERQRSNHHLDSAEFARLQLTAEGWSEERIAAVEHCIRAHRFRDDHEQPQTLEAQVLFDADKIDAIGAVGVARAISYAVTHGQPFFAQPSELFLRTGTKEPGEAHSAYHEYVFKLCKLKNRLFTRAAAALAEGRHQRMTAYFAQLQEEAALRPIDIR